MNPRLQSIPPSAIRAMHERKRPTSLDLGMGEPSLLPDPEPFARATQWVREHGCPYAPPAGLPQLRERIAQIYGGRFCGQPENVCVTNGSQEGIFLALKTLLRPEEDEVLVTNPCYPSYSRACDLEGVRCHAVTLSQHNGFDFEAEALLEAVTPRTRLIMFGSPANPTGAVMQRRGMQRLAQGLLERRGPPVYLLVDEVYRELTFTREPYTSFMDVYPYTLALNSLSKSCALTGLRLGFFFGPSAIVEAAIRAHGLMLMSVNMFAQQVALEILSRPGALNAHVPWYSRQRQLLLQNVKQHALSIIEPQGAFYCLLALPSQCADSNAAAQQLLELQDVVTIPGAVFGSAANRYLRLTWAAPADTVTDGLARIATFLSVR